MKNLIIISITFFIIISISCKKEENKIDSIKELLEGYWILNEWIKNDTIINFDTIWMLKKMTFTINPSYQSRTADGHIVGYLRDSYYINPNDNSAGTAEYRYDYFIIEPDTLRFDAQCGSCHDWQEFALSKSDTKFEFITNDILKFGDTHNSKTFLRQ